MTPTPVVPDEKNDNFFGIYYGVDVEAPNDGATVTHFMKARIRFVVQEPEITGIYAISDNIVWPHLGKEGSGLSDHDNRTVICADYGIW